MGDSYQQFDIVILYCKSTFNCVKFACAYCQIIYFHRGHRGHDRMVVGFTTTYAISAYQQ